MALILLKKEIKKCTLCTDHLPHGVRPIIQADVNAKILLVGQAPGRKVHETGIPFNDPSGDRLRSWLGVDRGQFYDSKRFAIVPMGFCFPGTGPSGDLPPRPECAPAWREDLLKSLPKVELVVVIGRYALDYHIPETRQQSVTKAVADWQKYWPHTIPLPHPSPRNNRWLKNNPWFEADVVPQLQQRVSGIM